MSDRGSDGKTSSAEIELQMPSGTPRSDRLAFLRSIATSPVSDAELVAFDTLMMKDLSAKRGKDVPLDRVLRYYGSPDIMAYVAGLSFPPEAVYGYYLPRFLYF